MQRRDFLKISTTSPAALLALMNLRAYAADATPPTSGTPIMAGDISALMLIRWELQRIERTEGTPVALKTPSRYFLQFLQNSQVRFRADCNVGSGQYRLSGDSMAFDGLITTLVACGSNSIGKDFPSVLNKVTGFTITTDANDELMLTTNDGDTLHFLPALTGVVWQFTRFESGDGSSFDADDPSRYTIEFLDETSVLIRADCNRGKGSATVEGNSIDMQVATTRMACGKDSIDTEYLRILEEASSWVIRQGKLAMALPYDSGIAFFTPRLQTEPGATPST